MKKIVFSLLAVALVTLLALTSLSGCGIIGAVETAKEQAAVNSKLDAINSQIDDLDFQDKDAVNSVMEEYNNALSSAKDSYTNNPYVKKFATMAEYCQDPSVAAELAAAETEGLDGTYTLDISGVGNTLIYEYKYIIDLGNLNAVRDTLSASADTLKQTFEPMVDTFQTFITTPGVSVKVRYLAKDGTVIFEQTYY